MPKSKFLDFLDSHKKCQVKLEKQILTYKDPFFKTLEKILASIQSFKNVKSSILRKICLKMKTVKISQHKRVIRHLEICRKAFFIFEGEVRINVLDPKTYDRVKFMILKPGSSFNFHNSILGYPALFEFVAESH